MRTPYVYCATCSRPLGTGSERARARSFCGPFCKSVYPGRTGARDTVMRALFESASFSPIRLGRLFGVSRQRAEKIVKGK